MAASARHNEGAHLTTLVCVCACASMRRVAPPSMQLTMRYPSAEADSVSKMFALLMLLLITIPASTNACPQYILSVCRCEELHNGVSLNCSSSNGTRAIELLRANQASLGLIQQLTVQNAQLTRVPAGFFSGLYIKKLDLSYNNLAEIDANAFLGMNNVLQELLLNHNSLTALPATSLVPLTNLLKLDISNNSIADLQPESALPS
uniref:Uncharacterized protein n=1 Tax=Parascaris univalens TaxID=6257 RepID=A0A915A449_PARUN